MAPFCKSSVARRLGLWVRMSVTHGWMTSFICNCVVLYRCRSLRWTDLAFKEAYRLCKIPSIRIEFWYVTGQRMLKRENNFIQLFSSKSVEHSRWVLIVTELVNWTHSVESEVLYHVRRRPWLTPVPILPLNEYVIKSDFDIVFPSASWHCKWYFPFTPSGQEFYVSYLLHISYLCGQSKFSRILHHFPHLRYLLFLFLICKFLWIPIAV